MKGKFILGISWLIISFAMVAFISLPRSAEGQTPKRPTTPSGSSRTRSPVSPCPHEWTKIFMGTVPSGREAANAVLRWYALDVGPTTTYEDLVVKIKAGCSFKVLRETGMGGGDERKSFECAVVKLNSGEGAFSCFAPTSSPDGDIPGEQYPSAQVLFSGPYYVQASNEATPYGSVSIFVHK